MSLSRFVSETRRHLYELLSSGRQPDLGEFDPDLYRRAKDRGQPQMGPVSYRPDRVVLDFIYPGDGSAAIVLAVNVDPPERIVYMPVPEWVVEQIWQGDVQGSYRFASEAAELLRRFEQLLEPSRNEADFGPAQQYKRG